MRTRRMAKKTEESNQEKVVALTDEEDLDFGGEDGDENDAGSQEEEKNNDGGDDEENDSSSLDQHVGVRDGDENNTKSEDDPNDETRSQEDESEKPPKQENGVGDEEGESSSEVPKDQPADEPQDGDSKGMQLGVSEEKDDKSAKNKETKADEKVYTKTRYYAIRSTNHRNVTTSAEKGMWATTARNRSKFNSAFERGENVILIFSVNKSQHFQGYARMTSKIGAVQAEWVMGKGVTLTDSFTVEWLKLHDLPISETEHIKNRLYENNPVWFCRDGTEIDEDAGKALCDLIDQHASGEVKPTKPSGEKPSSADLVVPTENPEKRSNPITSSAPLPVGGIGGGKVCFQFKQKGFCDYGKNCRFSHGDEAPTRGGGGGRDFEGPRPGRGP
eukprot:CAMPEP_0194715406 /NCGR_PEP_ID=MMETSP0296-20130528/7141_1 /TAXON_ID=39354 /ORGANISM="Heterosigma akashiwo, Strain CCMP2393" /LENGTH=387 /DNA_ID=CAMNT_0039615235 /DNA_START=41 /DNA_END=1201 /DNA_ORIENTATION=+